MKQTLETDTELRSLSVAKQSNRMVRILLVVPKYEPDIEKRKLPYFLPLGLMYVSSYLKKKGYDVDSVNLNHYEDDKLRAVLEKTSYDVICTGGLFTELVPITTVVDTAKRTQPEAKVVLGGALATADPEFALENLDVDFLILGEGEVSMANLCIAIAHKSNFKDVKGIAFNENGELFRTPPPISLIEDLDSLPSPDYEGFEYGHYLNNHQGLEDTDLTVAGDEKPRMAYVITSRNCVAKCTFCYRLMTGGHRVRTIENTMQEIKYLIDKYGVNEINLIDEMFANDKKRIYDFCKGIKPLGIRWQCQLRVGVIDKYVLEAMKDAGCHYISYGFESASKKVLKSMKKGAHPKQFEDVIRWTSDAGITIQGNWIFGDPAETLETMEETIQFRKKFGAIQFGFFLIIPYPGTVLYNDLKKRGAFKDLVAFYKNPSSVFGAFPLNMTELPEKDFKYMARKVWLEGHIGFIPAKVLSSKKIDARNSMINFQCPNCSEKNQDIRISINGKSIFKCKKCRQKIRFYRSDITFDLYDKLRRVYHHFILRPMLFNSATHRIFSPIIGSLEGRGKIGGLVKHLLRGK